MSTLRDRDPSASEPVPGAVSEPASTRWVEVLLVVAAGVVASFHVGKVPPAIPFLRADLGLSLLVAGWVLSLLYPIGAATGMTVGWVADRLGHRRTILTGLALLAAGSLTAPWLAGGGGLLATRFLEGCGFIMVIVSAPALILRAAQPRDARFAFGLWGGYMPGGTALMMVVSPMLLAGFGWRGAWIGAGGVTVALALALSVLLRAPPPRAAVRSGPSLLQAVRATLKAPAPLLLAGNFCFYSMSFMTVFGFLPSFLIERQGTSPATAAVLTAAAVGCNVIGNIAAGWLTRRGAARSLLIGTACVTMGLAAQGIFSESVGPWFRYGLCLLFSAVGGLLPTTVIGAAADVAPHPGLIASTSGLFVQGSNLGQLVGPPALAALIGATGGWPVAGWFLASTGTAGVLFALAYWRLERGRPSGEG